MSICYDLRFPELYRRLARAGATIITIPSAFTAYTGAAHWEPLLRARAIENQVYVIAPNQSGTSPHGFTDYGNSMIVDPWGTVVARAGDGEAVITAEIDARSAWRACGARCRASQHARLLAMKRRRAPERGPRPAHRRSESVSPGHVRGGAARCCARFRALPAERIAVAEAAGRVLARDVRTTLDLPHFARSYMDGFAVRARDTTRRERRPRRRTSGSSAASRWAIPSSQRLRAGEAMRIPTGGMLPAGADAVVMVEHTRETRRTASSRSRAPRRRMQHVMRRGEDAKKGTRHLRARPPRPARRRRRALRHRARARCG